MGTGAVHGERKKVFFSSDFTVASCSGERNRETKKKFFFCVISTHPIREKEKY
jgi:hypothetical protein